MIHHYRQMVDDPVRIEAFERAIRAVVKPGDVVVDAGCGLGTYAVLAARAGARRVYAIDEKAVLEAARDVVHANGCADRVVFFAGRTTDLEPPERAHVILFEDYEAGFYAPSTIAGVRDLATRWLAPGGRIVPGQVRVFAAAVQDAEGALAIDRLRSRNDRVAGVDFTATRARAFSTPQPRRLFGNALLTAPVEIATLDVTHLPDALTLDAIALITRDGTLHGLLVWFELVLPSETIDTGPLSLPTAWSQLLLPIDPAPRVTRGQTCTLRLDAAPFGPSAIWRWQVATNDSTVTGNSLPGLLLAADSLKPR